MNIKAILITIVLFLIEVCIAIFVNDSFARPFLGDVLAVILLYWFCRIWLNHSLKLVAFTFLVGCFLEFLQWLQVLEILGLNHITWLRIVLGSSFDWRDLLAYAVGGLVVYYCKIFN